MADQTHDTPVLDLLADMTTDSVEASNLDAETLLQVRIAALVAVDAPVASYLMNLGVASDLDIGAEQVEGILAAVAPIVGTARVVCGGRQDHAGDRHRDRDRRTRSRGRPGRVAKHSFAVPCPIGEGRRSRSVRPDNTSAVRVPWSWSGGQKWVGDEPSTRADVVAAVAAEGRGYRCRSRVVDAGGGSVRDGPGHDRHEHGDRDGRPGRRDRRDGDPDGDHALHAGDGVVDDHRRQGRRDHRPQSAHSRSGA